MDRPPFVEHGLELLAPLGPVSTRRMFGGWGIYADGLFVALIAFEQLYLKADEETRPHFVAAGCEPFVYVTSAGQRSAMNYWTVPADALEAPPLMLPWARLALQAALRAQAAKAVKAAKPAKVAARRRIKPAGPAAPG